MWVRKRLPRLKSTGVAREVWQPTKKTQTRAPSGQSSHASPAPSPSASSCPAFIMSTQLRTKPPGELAVSKDKRVTSMSTGDSLVRQVTNTVSIRVWAAAARGFFNAASTQASRCFQRVRRTAVRPSACKDTKRAHKHGVKRNWRQHTHSCITYTATVRPMPPTGRMSRPRRRPPARRSTRSRPWTRLPLCRRTRRQHRKLRRRPRRSRRSKGYPKRRTRTTQAPSSAGPTDSRPTQCLQHRDKCSTREWHGFPPPLIQKLTLRRSSRGC